MKGKRAIKVLQGRISFYKAKKLKAAGNMSLSDAERNKRIARYDEKMEDAAFAIQAISRA